MCVWTFLFLNNVVIEGALDEPWLVCMILALSIKLMFFPHTICLLFHRCNAITSHVGSVVLRLQSRIIVVLSLTSFPSEHSFCTLFRAFSGFNMKECIHRRRYSFPHVFCPPGYRLCLPRLSTPYKKSYY